MTIKKRLTLGVVALIALPAAALADPVGTQGFADINTPTANGSPTGDINTATAFTIGAPFVSTSASTGIFVGMPTQTFGMLSFTTTSPTSIAFGNSVFGHFTSTSIVEASNVPGAVAFDVFGSWAPGSQGSVTGGPFGSELTITFNQTPDFSGSISTSMTFSTPLATVPEPATFALMALGIAGVGFAGRRRRR